MTTCLVVSSDRLLQKDKLALHHERNTAIQLLSVLTGRRQVIAAAADAGVVKILVMLLQEDYSSRVAYEASELLMLLTEESDEQAGLAGDTVTLECMLELIRTLLQASDALSDTDACAYSMRTPAAPADMASLQSLIQSKMSNLKVPPLSAGPTTATVIASQSSDQPRVSWASTSVEAKPGLPVILTLPNGVCNEVSVPQSPSACAEPGVSHDSSAAARNQSTGRPSLEASMEWGHAASIYPRGTAVPSKGLDTPSSPGKSVSNRFGSLLKKLGSIHLRSSGSAGPDQPQSLTAPSDHIPTSAPGAASPASSSCTPLSVAFARSQSIRSDSFQPGAAAVKTAYQPRHSSQAVLRAVVMAMANLLSSNPGAQESLIKLGAVGVIHDVFVLAGSVGLQGGLAKAGAQLVKSISSDNPAAQEAFGNTLAVHHLLNLLLVSVQSFRLLHVVAQVLHHVHNVCPACLLPQYDG